MAAALCATVSLCLAACDNSVIYDGYVSIAKEGWDKDTLAIFRADVEDTVGVYDVWIQVRNDNDYQFSNLWLFVDVVSPDGVSRRDTVECILARPDGSWIGGGWGSLYSERCRYISSVRFSRPGPYTFRITQGMRADNLKGIHDIGLLIESAKGSESHKR